MKPINYYISKFVSIFSSECSLYKKGCEGCYESADKFRQFLCWDTRGWFSDGTRCSYFKKQGLISKLAEKVMSKLTRLRESTAGGTLEDETR